MKIEVSTSTVVIAAVMVALFALIYMSVKYEMDYAEGCEKQGGVVIEAPMGRNCIKVEVLKP